MRRAQLLTALCTLLSLVGCGPGFDPRTLVTDFRVLAMRAEPPEVAPGEETTFDALVVDPDGEGDALVYSFVQCTLAGSGCIEQAEALAEAGGDAEAAQVAYQKTSVRYGLTFIQDGSAEPVGANLKTASSLLEATGQEAANAQVSMVVCPAAACAAALTGGGEGDALSPEGSLLAIKRARVSQGEAPNRNPVITGLRVGPGVRGGGGEAVPPGGEIAAVPGELLDIAVVMPPGSAEAYLFSNDDGEVEERVERLYVSWFSTAGGFEFSSTDTYVEPATGEVRSVVAFEVEGAEDIASPFSLYAVVWDRRGGLGWIEARVRL